MLKEITRLIKSGCRNGMIDLSLSNKDPILADGVQE